jgi:predicted enzyme related to lactoylglutathione lyase
MIDPTASRTTDQPGGLPVTTSFTLTIDCADADQMMEFWITALGYKPKDPPEGFDDWCSYFRSIGVPEEELGGSCTAYLVDPEGVAPQMPVALRKQRVEAEVDRLIAAGATGCVPSTRWWRTATSWVMQDPEGNEFCLS